MPLLPRVRSLWRNLLQRDRVERDLEEELRGALELLVAEKMRGGMMPAQARRAATLELGGVEPVKQQVRDVRTGVVADALFQDLRYAFRHIRRSPAFAAAAILTLAFGIGANTAMFTVLNALVLQRLPIADPDGLIAVSGRDARGLIRSIPISAVDALAREGPFERVCGYSDGFFLAVEANGAPAQAVMAMVTGQCFAVFGVSPILGRTITDEDAHLYTPGNRVAVISHRFWTRMFGADPQVLGKRIRAEGIELSIIGVLPEGFGGLQVDSGAEVFAPNDTVLPARKDRRPFATQFLARLRPGVSLQEAAAHIAASWPAVLDVAVPATIPAPERADLLAARPHVERMGTGVSLYRDRYARPVTMIFWLTGLLLLLACVNLGGLLLARLSSRASELAVRLALGGSQRRIAQQMLSESLLLSLSGAALAVPMSFAFIAPLTSFLPRGLAERTVAFTPDLRVLTVTVIVGLGVGVLMSALPTWVALRRQAGARFVWDRTIAGATAHWGRALLVVQVAFSVVLLVGAGLLTRSLYLLQRVDLGVHAAGVLTVRLQPVPGGRLGFDHASYYTALVEKLSALPGVRSVAFARSFPRQIAVSVTQPIAFVGETTGSVLSSMEGMSPEFFETVGIPLLAGRLPSWSDDDKSRHVAVVSESLAKALAPDGDVLERRVRYGTLEGHQDIVIVGVVGNATMGNPRVTSPHVIYRPGRQWGRGTMYATILIATNGDTSTLPVGVTRVLKDAGREYAHEIATLEDVLARAPVSEWMSATLAGVVAGLALVLALIGIHGALAYSVSRRTREIGVRVAVGAAPGAVARAVLQESFVVTLIGVALGLPVAFLAARALRTLMFGVSEADPFIFSATAVFILAMGLAAGMIPARRAARVDPVVALRAE